MKPFENFVGIVAPLPYDNIDTDAIIPSREIRSPERTGFGEKLFSAWRYIDNPHTENPEFILNQHPFRHATILLAGHNFGCGSSREMAVWALMQFGFKAIIAKSFGSIFKNNCNKNGLLTITISEQTYQSLIDSSENNPVQLKINLPQQMIELANGPAPLQEYFEIDSETKNYLLTGEDEISKTLKYLSSIKKFCEVDRESRPWMYEK